jgi:hypothetical protein
VSAAMRFFQQLLASTQREKLEERINFTLDSANEKLCVC